MRRMLPNGHGKGSSRSSLKSSEQPLECCAEGVMLLQRVKTVAVPNNEAIFKLMYLSLAQHQ